MRHPAALLTLALVGCLSPPPPIVVETPFGDVRAMSEAKAAEVAELLEDLAPRVRELLPGCQERSVDVWVQDQLQVYRYQERPESVRGFTLLAGDFDARRIHLQSDSESPWYLAHELVHALVDRSWRALPGILEEGLGDVIAGQLEPEHARRIRTHRLLNVSAVAGGFDLTLAYSVPQDGQLASQWPRERRTTRVRPVQPVASAMLDELLRMPRTALHERYSEIPECYYGVAWLLSSRIVERRGLAGLHELCLRADGEGRALVPPEWIYAAAELEPAQLTPEFMTSCLGFDELRSCGWLKPDAIASVALDALSPWMGRITFGRLLARVNPCLVDPDGREVPLRSMRPVVEQLADEWRAAETRTPHGTSPPTPP
jgi:hypothetical protein